VPDQPDRGASSAGKAGAAGGLLRPQKWLVANSSSRFSIVRVAAANTWARAESDQVRA
jgi:hypothetical protein